MRLLATGGLAALLFLTGCHSDRGWWGDEDDDRWDRREDRWERRDDRWERRDDRWDRDHDWDRDRDRRWDRDDRYSHWEGDGCPSDDHDHRRWKDRFD